MRLKRMVAVLMLVAGAAWAGDKFEDRKIGVGMEMPDGFTAAQKPEDSPVGEILAFYTSPQAAENGGLAAVHRMELPAGSDFDDFKTTFAQQLGERFNSGLYKVLKQDETRIPKLTGFVLELQVPGNGRLPDPEGTVPHRIRWYFFKQPDATVAGIILSARESAWAEMEKKLDASARTIRALQ